MSKDIVNGLTLRVIHDKILTGNDVGPDIKNGITYVALDTYTCNCGELHIDIGLKSIYNSISCYKCGEELPNGSEVHWCHELRFEIIHPAEDLEIRSSL